MNTVALNYKTVGEGESIVILHGLFGSLDNWQTMARSISEEGYQVVTIDLRNHGKSPHTDEMSHQLMAEDVKAFLKKQQIENCTLVGHSMGGKTAMQLALTSPELISGLVVVDIAPKPYTARHNVYFKAMMELNVQELESRKEARQQLGKSIKNDAIKQFLLKNLDRTDDGYQWKFNLNALYEHYEELISGLESSSSFAKPSLFISGQLSDYISAADMADIQRLFPNSRVEVVENSGHWVHAEQPESFQKLLLEFVQQK